LRIKEKETRLNLHEYGDDDDNDKFYTRIYVNCRRGDLFWQKELSFSGISLCDRQ